MYTIDISFKYIRYNEDLNSIEFDVELQSDGISVIYVPNDSNWLQTTAKWAINRKQEIINNMKNYLSEKFGDKKFLIKEY